MHKARAAGARKSSEHSEGQFTSFEAGTRYKQHCVSAALDGHAMSEYLLPPHLNELFVFFRFETRNETLFIYCFQALYFSQK